MTGAAVAVAVMLVVGTVLGLLRQRHRIRALEQAEMYEAHQILQRARDRKDRRHLHLLVAIPLTWLAGRLSTAPARLAAASAVSAMMIGTGVSTDSSWDPPPRFVPPAGAETTVPTMIGEAQSYTYSPSSPTTSTGSSVAGLPPAPATDPVAVPTTSVPPSATPSAPATTTTLLAELPDTTTTSTVIELPPLEPIPCLNPQGKPLPVGACP